MTIDDDSSIYVGGLPHNITEETLRKAFGVILTVKIVLLVENELDLLLLLTLDQQHKLSRKWMARQLMTKTIIGSSNINQRSMDGARDSEIATGAYQSYHLSHNQPSRGQIHGFRMLSWYEHLGLLDNSFSYPQSMECQQKVNRLAQSNWELYALDWLKATGNFMLRKPRK